jgi:hypothetical protein
MKRSIFTSGLLLLLSCDGNKSPTANIEPPPIVEPGDQPSGPTSTALRTSTGFWYPTGIPPGADDRPRPTVECNRSERPVSYRAEETIEASTGDRIYAIADGEVLYSSSGTDSEWGEGNIALALRHRLADGTAFLAIYGNIRSSITRGPVAGGQPLGTLGPALGRGAGEPTQHLHFAITTSTQRPSRWGTTPCSSRPDTNGFVDPIDWIQKKTPAAGTPPPAPSAPTSLGAQAVSSSSISLSWQDNSTHELQYLVYRWVGSAWQQIGALASDATSYTDSGLQAGTTYRYTVCATNSAGWACAQNPESASATTSSASLTAPSNLTAVALSSSSIRFTWQDNSTSETEHLVYRRNGGEWQQIGTVGRDVTSYTDNGLQPAVTYTYTVCVVSSPDWACANDTVSATTSSATTPRSMIPLTDLGTGLYLGLYQGGLYENGSNEIPADHAARARTQLAQIVPRNSRGAPDSKGKIILTSVGMSTTSQIFCREVWNADGCKTYTFTGQAAADPAVNGTTLVLFNGAAAAQTSEYWAASNALNYARIDSMLRARGHSSKQIQVAWISLVRYQQQGTSRADSSLSHADANAYKLLRDLGWSVRAMRTRWPNLQIAFLSSYIYGGYDIDGVVIEPFAYESGLAVKWLIEAQIQQARTGIVHNVAGDLSPTVAPVLLWGPYLWADGTTPRSDGLVWIRSDYDSDGRHPSQAGQKKAGKMLLDFFKSSPFSTCWFLASGSC